MQGEEVSDAGGCPPNDAVEFAAHARRVDGHDQEAVRPCASSSWQSLRKARPQHGRGLKCVVMALSAFLPVAALADPFGAIRLFDSSALPLVGSIAIVLAMLMDADTRQFLWKALGRCAVVMLVAPIVGVAFRNHWGLGLIALAPWICFLLLLRVFLQSALGSWDRPRPAPTPSDAGAGDVMNEAEPRSVAAESRRMRIHGARAVASNSSPGALIEVEDDLDSVLDSILSLPDGLSIRVPHEAEPAAVRAAVERAQKEGALPESRTDAGPAKRTR